MPAESELHIDPDSLNALLAEFAVAQGKQWARFEGGALQLQFGALRLSVERLVCTADGVDIHLQCALEGESA